MQTGSGLNLVLFEDEIWAIGGGNVYSASVDSVEAYNVESNTWATKESLSTSRRWAAAWSYDGKIYSAGGVIVHTISLVPLKCLIKILISGK